MSVARRQCHPPDCSDIKKTLIAGGQQINQSHTPYNPWGPNSNTTTRELLDLADIPLPDSHAGLTIPGWGDDLACINSPAEAKRRKAEAEAIRKYAQKYKEWKDAHPNYTRHFD